MTRLQKQDLRDIGKTLPSYENHLVQMTGLTLKGIAIRAAGISEKTMENGLLSIRAAVVPTTCGEGVIEGFADSVRDILRYVGANVFRSGEVDVAGIAEVIEGGVDIVFIADDRRFIAMYLPSKRMIDNTEATAKGYVEALRGIVRDLESRKVLVIGGAGRVGWHAICALRTVGAEVSAYDPDRKRLDALLMNSKVLVENELEEALGKYDILFDASPTEEIIRSEHVKPSTVVAAPGIPLGLSEDAYFLVKDRLIHDPLQIGVATMLAEAISQKGKRWGVDRKDRCGL